MSLVVLIQGFFSFSSLPCAGRSKALPVDKGMSTLVVPLLQDPHLLEGGEVQSDSLLLHAVSNAGVLLNSVSRHDGVDVQAIPDVHNTLCDEVVGGLVDDAGFHYQEARLEGLRAPEPLVVEGDDLAVGSQRRWTSAAQDLGRDSTVAH